jgi:hypothetical protein
MSGRVRDWLAGLLVGLGVVLAAGAVLACVGDCNGDGMVSVAELIEGVRISLGDGMVSECPAFEATADGQVGIEDLIMAVSAALDGCPATPTPLPTGTATVTATSADTPTATGTPRPPDTPTATPTVPMVAGRWHEVPLAVSSSTCVSLLTQQFGEELAARPACDQTIEAQTDTTVALIDCTGTRLDGTLERDGTIRFTYPTKSETVDQGCDLALTPALVVPAAVSPTTATYTFAIAFSGTCPLSDCTIEAQGTWTRD